MNEQQAIKLLKKYSNSEKDFEAVLKHSKIVQKLSLEIGSEIIKNGKKVDLEFIKSACILHDIGSFKYPPWNPERIKHGIYGAEILKKEGLEKRYILLAERHMGVGISKEDIEKQSLPLPKKDYIPKTLEEKIITYADKLEDDNQVKGIDHAIERYGKELGRDYANRLVLLHNEIEKLRGREDFKKQLK